MMTLIRCEWERIWRKRWVWSLVVAIPGLAYFAANYFEAIQASPELISDLFVLVGLRENLYFPFNIMVAALVTSVYTEEFRGGQLRLIFLRHFTRHQVFFSKLLVVYFLIFIMLIWFAISLAVIGFFLFPEVSGNHRAWGTIIEYTLQYYGWAYASLIGISSFFCCVAMYSKNVTYAMGIGMLYILVALLLDGLVTRIAALFQHVPYIQDVVTFMMIPYLQHTGLNAVLAGNFQATGAVISIISVYILAFTWAAYRRFVKDDYVY